MKLAIRLQVLTLVCSQESFSRDISDCTEFDESSTIDLRTTESTRAELFESLMACNELYPGLIDISYFYKSFEEKDYFVDTLDYHYTTALMVAAEEGIGNFIQPLLDSGADINMKSNEG